MSSDFAFSKKDKRTVSAFFGIALLYEWVLGVLDGERTKAVESFLASSPQAVKKVQGIRENLAYLESLSNTGVSQNIIDQIEAGTSTLNKANTRLRQFRVSPIFKLALEISGTVLGIVLLTLLIPWHRLMNLEVGTRETVLAEIEKPVKVIPFQEDASIVTVRGSLRVPDFEKAQSALFAKITELQGTLGTNNENPKEFDIRIPVDKYTAMVSFLKNYDFTEVDKDTNLTNTTSGFVRLILNTELKK